MGQVYIVQGVVEIGEATDTVNSIYFQDLKKIKHTPAIIIFLR